MTSPVSAPPRSPATDLERPAPDEAGTIAALDATMRRIQETILKDYGHALRSVHAKSHALIEGEMRVLDGLPPELAQGLFALPAPTGW